MCFSATGSFIAGAVNATAGAAALHRTAGTRESVLAAFPLAFAVQQTMEGVLWLEIPGHADAAPISAVANGFVFLALVVWPVLAPFVALPAGERPIPPENIDWSPGIGRGVRQLFGLPDPVAPVRRPNTGAQHFVLQRPGVPAFKLHFSIACALVCHCFCRTQNSMKLLGLFVLIGLAVSYLLFFYTFLSVWCFFAALASGVVFFRAYFEVSATGAAPRLERGGQLELLAAHFHLDWAFGSAMNELVDKALPLSSICFVGPSQTILPL